MLLHEVPDTAGAARLLVERGLDVWVVGGPGEKALAFFRRCLPIELRREKAALLGFANMLFKLLSDYRPKGVAVAWDTRPVHRHEIAEAGDVVDAVETVSEHLIATHVHDNRGRSDDHLLPFDGTIDWAGTLLAVQKIGYDGPFTFEVVAFGDEEGVRFGVTLIGSKAMAGSITAGTTAFEAAGAGGTSALSAREATYSALPKPTPSFTGAANSPGFVPFQRAKSSGARLPSASPWMRSRLIVKSACICSRSAS